MMMKMRRDERESSARTDVGEPPVSGLTAIIIPTSRTQSLRTGVRSQ